LRTWSLFLHEKADTLAGKVAEKPGHSRLMSIAHLKLRISKKFRKRERHGTRRQTTTALRRSLPPPKKSCLDSMRNALARAAAQIRTGHWRSTVYLKPIRKMAEDKCWFCQSSARVTRSHVLLHCPSAKLNAARTEAWEGKTPGGVRVLLANPRWERRFVKFLELTGVGRGDG
jgi:hypothetical protein